MRGALVRLAAVAVMLAGCQTTQGVWVRVDGKAGAKAAQQLELDKTICDGEVAKANVSGTQFCWGLGDCVGAAVVRGIDLNTVYQGCMASRGYVRRQFAASVSK